MSVVELRQRVVLVESKADTRILGSRHFRNSWQIPLIVFLLAIKLWCRSVRGPMPISQICPNVCENSTYACHACLPCRLRSCLRPILHLHRLLSLLSVFPSLPICNNSAHLYLTEWLRAVSNQDFERAASLCHIITSRIYRRHRHHTAGRQTTTKTKPVVGDVIFLPR